MYFENFPVILHGINGPNDQEILVRLRDITRNVRVRRDVLANITLYEEYTIRDGETAQLIAEKVYGDAQLHWVVMLVNEKYDYVSDFPLTSLDLLDHVTRKYGAGNEYATHHYINSQGYIVNSTDPSASSVSNFDYEEAINEDKRKIKLISPSLISVLLANFDALMAV
jgi:hypothetical protein